MTKRVSANYKLDRRMGENVWGRAKSPVNKREYGPGEHGQRRKGKMSDFGIQLRAKQKLKGYYANISEKKFRKYYSEAGRRSGDTGDNLVAQQDQRLHAVVNRAKVVPPVSAARQVVNHGHVAVNGQKVDVPSYVVKEGDVVEVRRKAHEIPMVIQAQQSSERDVPEYIQADGLKATFVRVPTLDEVPYPVRMEPNLVVEFYSR